MAQGGLQKYALKNLKWTNGKDSPIALKNKRQYKERPSPYRVVCHFGAGKSTSMYIKKL